MSGPAVHSLKVEIDLAAMILIVRRETRETRMGERVNALPEAQPA